MAKKTAQQENSGGGRFSNFDMNNQDEQLLTARSFRPERGTIFFLVAESIEELESTREDGPDTYEVVRGFYALPEDMSRDIPCSMSDRVIVNTIKEGVDNGAIIFGKTVLKCYCRGEEKANNGNKYIGYDISKYGTL